MNPQGRPKDELRHAQYADCLIRHHAAPAAYDNAARRAEAGA